MCSDQTNSFLTSVNCVSKNKHQLSRKTSMIPSWRTSSSVVVRKLVICRNQNLIKISMAIEKNVWLKKSKSKEKFRSQRGFNFSDASLFSMITSVLSFRVIVVTGVVDWNRPQLLQGWLERYLWNSKETRKSWNNMVPACHISSLLYRRWKDKYDTPETRHTLLYKKTSRTMLFHGKSHIWRFLLHLFFSLQPSNLARIWSNVSALLWLCAVRHNPGSTVKVMDLVWIGLGVKSKSSLSSSFSLFKYHSRLLQNSTRRVSIRRSSLCITHEKPFVQPRKCFPRKKAIPSRVSAIDSTLSPQWEITWDSIAPAWTHCVVAFIASELFERKIIGLVRGRKKYPRA